MKLRNLRNVPTLRDKINMRMQLLAKAATNEHHHERGIIIRRTEIKRIEN